MLKRIAFSMPSLNAVRTPAKKQRPANKIMIFILFLRELPDA
jgi:hypothetical protein